ncbi:hypothetical protein ACHAXN_008346 [Cyclotella atomus]
MQNLNIEDSPEPEVGIDNLNVHGLTLLGSGKSGKQTLDILKPTHLLVDSCASYCSTPYRDLLKNIIPQDTGLIGYGNAGSTYMKEAGSIGNLNKVWLNEEGIANILPLRRVELCNNEAGYTHSEVKDARAASHAQAMIGSPLDREFRKME